MNNRIYDMLKLEPSAESLWDGDHKIPWNDRAFSARILGEHLSQDHHLASRKRPIIEAQAAWIGSKALNGLPASILDLGCGPGLYSGLLTADGHTYLGLDFSPASIEYAQNNFGKSGKREFRLGDVLETDFGGPFELVTMLYGELNVFSPAQCRSILNKACNALAPGGRLLIERQRTHAVRKMGRETATWTRAKDGGLFSGTPYVCLTENHWFERDGVSLQCFHVLPEGEEAPVTYRSTTKAWSGADLESLLTEVGFTSVRHHEDWPVQDDSLALMSAGK